MESALKIVFHGTDICNIPMSSGQMELEIARPNSLQTDEKRNQRYETNHNVNVQIYIQRANRQPALTLPPICSCSLFVPLFVLVCLFAS